MDTEAIVIGVLVALFLLVRYAVTARMAEREEGGKLRIFFPVALFTAVAVFILAICDMNAAKHSPVNPTTERVVCSSVCR